MKKMILVLMIAILLVCGMVLVSCGNPACPGDGKCKDTLGSLLTGGWCDNYIYDDCTVGGKCACK